MCSRLPDKNSDISLTVPYNVFSVFLKELSLAFITYIDSDFLAKEASCKYRCGIIGVTSMYQFCSIAILARLPTIVPDAEQGFASRS